MRLRNGNVPAVAVLLCGIAAGCATQGPKPTEEVTRAQTLIEQADRAGAQRYAAADLQRAHDELNNADKANADKKYDEARRYAESAAADADVAQARAAAGEAQRAAKEVQQSNETLRQESDRGATPGRSGIGPTANPNSMPPPDATQPPETTNLSAPQGEGAPQGTALPHATDSTPRMQNPN